MSITNILVNLQLTLGINIHNIEAIEAKFILSLKVSPLYFRVAAEGPLRGQFAYLALFQLSSSDFPWHFQPLYASRTMRYNPLTALVNDMNRTVLARVLVVKMRKSTFPVIESIVEIAQNR